MTVRWATTAPYDTLTASDLNATLDAGRVNLVENSHFRSFDASSRPLWWGYSGTVAKETGAGNFLTLGSSVKLSAGAGLAQDLYGLLQDGWVGRNLTLRVAVKADTAADFAVNFDFGVSTSTVTNNVGTDWEVLSATAVVPSSATKVKFQMSTTADVAYLDAIQVSIGTADQGFFTGGARGIIKCEGYVDGTGGSAAWNNGATPRLLADVPMAATSLSGASSGGFSEDFSTGSPDYWPTGTSNPVSGTGDTVIAMATYNATGNNARGTTFPEGELTTNGKIAGTVFAYDGTTYSTGDLDIVGLMLLYPIGPEPPLNRAWTD